MHQQTSTIRARSGAWRLVLGVLALIGAILAATSTTGNTADAATAGWPTVPLLTTERFQPGQTAPVQSAARAVAPPQQVHLARGEQEGFLLAVKAQRTGYLEASLDGSSAGALRKSSARGDARVRFLRVDWVKVGQRSSGMPSLANGGIYADPLPPQVPGSNPGRLRVKQGHWYAFYVLVAADSGMSPGKYAGTIRLHLYDNAGSLQGTAATRDFSATVYNLRRANGKREPLAQPGDARRFGGLFGESAPGQYRDYPSSVHGAARVDTPGWANVNRFLADHGVSPARWFMGTANGSNSCSSRNDSGNGRGLGRYAAPEYDRLNSYLDTRSWFSNRDGAFSQNIAPHDNLWSQPATCPGAFSLLNGGSSLVGSTAAQQFLSRTRADLVSMGEWGNGIPTYVINPFDEPSDSLNNTLVPRANSWIRSWAPGARSFVTTWPQSTGPERFFIRTYRGWEGATVRVDNTDNRVQWDRNGGKCARPCGNDTDIFVVPPHRQHGQYRAGARMPDRAIYAQAYRNRMAQMQRKGFSIWTYNLFQPTQRIPQMTIDGFPYDTRLFFWQLAHDGRSGFYLYDTSIYRNHFGVYGSNRGGYRNLWTQPISYATSQYRANGWGSIYYPAYYRPHSRTNPLDNTRDGSEGANMALNDSNAQPVSSLRMEQVRDGIEDATLANMFRARFGEANYLALVGDDATTRPLDGIFREQYAWVSELTNLGIGNVTYRAYLRGTGSTSLPVRMEATRRQMLRRMSQ